MKENLKSRGARLLTLLAIFMLSGSALYAQKVAFVASDVIRDKFPEAKQADQRIRSIVDEWKRELDDLEKQIDDLQFDIKKNRLVWSDEERAIKEKKLEELREQRLDYARKKFESNGDYDATVKMMMQPIEDKIYAAIQEVASDEGYDIIWDKSVQPLAYSNSKYDITVKVLRKLGVDVEALEKELQEKIAKDPRNAKKDTKQAPGKRSRSREKSKEARDVERDQQTPADDNNVDQPPDNGQNPQGDTINRKMPDFMNSSPDKKPDTPHK
jgi:outer membrane protein